MRSRASASSSTTSTVMPDRSGPPEVRDRGAELAGMHAREVVRGLRAPPMSGSSTVNVAPCPSPGLGARTVPPCSSTSCFTIERPSPSPPAWRVVRRVGLAEAVEHVRQELGRDADAGVGDA